MQKFNINVRSIIQQIKFLFNIAQIYGNIGTLHVAMTSTDNNGMIDLNEKALIEFRKIKPSMRIPLELLEMIYKSKTSYRIPQTPQERDNNTPTEAQFLIQKPHFYLSTMVMLVPEIQKNEVKLLQEVHSIMEAQNNKPSNNKP